MAEPAIRVVGIPWYRRHDYPKLLTLFEDAGDLQTTYEEWLESAEALVEELEGAGHIIERVYIDPSEFSNWCRMQGLRMNGEARTEFARAQVAANYGRQSD